MNEPKIKRINIIIRDDDSKICNLFAEVKNEGTEAGTGITGWRVQEFGNNVSEIDILSQHVPNFLNWPKGKIER